MNVNKGYTAFIVDDNPAALETLATDLRQQPEFAEVYTFASYAEATLPLLEKQPDVLFLDVEVPGKTGLEFLDSIRSKVTFTFKVVFYTGFSDYMIDAIRQSAFDYLLKPYKQSELRLIIDRMKQSENERVLQRIGSDAMQRKIAMQTVSELLLINLDEALMFNLLKRTTLVGAHPDRRHSTRAEKRRYGRRPGQLQPDHGAHKQHLHYQPQLPCSS